MICRTRKEPRTHIRKVARLERRTRQQPNHLPQLGSLRGLRIRNWFQFSRLERGIQRACNPTRDARCITLCEIGQDDDGDVVALVTIDVRTETLPAAAMADALLSSDRVHRPRET